MLHRRLHAGLDEVDEGIPESWLALLPRLMLRIYFQGTVLKRPRAVKSDSFDNHGLAQPPKPTNIVHRLFQWS